MRMEEFIAKMNMEREFMDTRLSRMDDTDMIKKWTQTVIDQAKTEIIDRLENGDKKVHTYVEQLRRENMVVDGLVGKGEKFKNLQDYLEFNHKNTDSKFGDLERWIKKYKDELKSEIVATAEEIKKQEEDDYKSATSYINDSTQKYIA
mmetsp:Transcript_12056/g.11928  ORF Transcript_12056/g.11928 Transcript_12056/m.11928 type:complete len:148 (-) Transcript_12056:95-538(-)